MESRYNMLVCCECGRGFVLTRKEQEFYAERDFKHYPKRCRSCRIHRRLNGKNNNQISAFAGIEKSLPSSDREV